MFEPKDEIEEAVDALMSLATEFNRGQIIPWESIEQFSGDRNTNGGKYIIDKWRRRLENERQIVTLCPPTVGVKLLTHREVVQEIPRLRQRKAYRQVRRAIKQTSLVDTSALTMAERRLLAAQRMNMAQQRRELFRSRRHLEAALRPTGGVPIRKSPPSQQ